MTLILATNQYLSRYRVVDSDLCSKCDAMPDTIQHRLMQCQLLVPFVDKIFDFLNQQCQVEVTINIKSYLFGFLKNAALNQILLELKKLIFYTWDPAMDVNSFFRIFISKIRKLMIIEKNIYLSTKSFDQYNKKWEKFKDIYDFNGPDLQFF